MHVCNIGFGGTKEVRKEGTEVREKVARWGEEKIDFVDIHFIYRVSNKTFKVDNILIQFSLDWSFFLIF